MSSSPGIVPRAASPSIRPSSHATEFISKLVNWRRGLLTCDLPQCAGSLMRLPTPGHTALNSQQAYNASRGHELGVRLGNWLTAEEARWRWPNVNARRHLCQNRDAFAYPASEMTVSANSAVLPVRSYEAWKGDKRPTIE